MDSKHGLTDTEVLQHLVDNHEEYFQTFSEEMAEQARQELIKAFKQKQQYDLEHNVQDNVE